MLLGALNAGSRNLDFVLFDPQEDAIKDCLSHSRRKDVVGINQERNRGTKTTADPDPQYYHHSKQEEILKYIRGPGMNCVVISGPQGSGKSWTTEYAISKLRVTEKKKPIIYLKMTGIDTEEQFVCHGLWHGVSGKTKFFSGDLQDDCWRRVLQRYDG